MSGNNLLFNSLIVFGLIGCMSSRDGRALKQDLFELNTRLVGLEGNVTKTTASTKNKGKAANLRLANSTAKVDRLEKELQQIKGEVDTLRVGVITGKLPGIDNEDESIAGALAAISERLDKLEESQMEILSTLSKKRGRKNKKKSASSSSKKNQLKKLADFRKAFEKKRYRHVVSGAPKALVRLKGAEKMELSYFEAESLFKLGKLRDAALKYDKFIEIYPKGKYITQAQMRMGDCFRHLGDSDTALIYYKEVVEKYPKSGQAKKSKDRIKDLEGTKSTSRNSFKGISQLIES